MKNIALLVLIYGLTGVLSASERYEAEDAIVDENTVSKIAAANASGGFYVAMKEGTLSFTVTMATTGFYTLWTSYSQPNDSNGKIQNLSVNGSSKGQISFPFTSDSFTSIKASSKIKLAAGINTIEITKSWGWVNIDYIEFLPYVAEPLQIASSPVTPNASKNTVKMYQFLKESFQKKIVSGIMTNTVFQNDGKYTPSTLETQTELAWIKNASGKIPALVGLDFLHATGLSSEGDWHHGYTTATLALAEETFKRGGFPAYCWHWMDPGKVVETFYTESSGNTPFTTFNLNNAFTDTSTYAAFNTSSAEYKAIIRDMDTVASFLKRLADKDIPVLWRPLHEASGKWFWWGYRGPKACKALYQLMFDRFTKTHGLKNLLWVWTTDEAGNAIDWYPGDAYVDIVGRDYYYYPRERNHGSLVASYEKVKELFGGRKIVALSENGSVPHPDSLVADGAGWSYFMPWYGDYAMDGWAHDNTAEDWKSIMNHDFVITLDEMPGWDNYIPAAVHTRFTSTGKKDQKMLFYHHGTIAVSFNTSNRLSSIELFTLYGARVATLRASICQSGEYRFAWDGAVPGTYLVKLPYSTGGQGSVLPLVVR